jgi:hypothetical protein
MQLTFAVVSYPVFANKKNLEGFERFATDQTRSSARLSRRFLGLAGSTSFSEQKSYLFTEPKAIESESPFVEICMLKLSFISENLATATFLFEGDFDELTIDGLRRIGTTATRKMLNDAGLDPQDKNFLFATCISGSDDGLTHASDAWLRYPDKNRSFFKQSVDVPLAEYITAERIILDQATDYLTEGPVRPKDSRTHLANLRSWQTTPSSESTRLLENVELLRNSLRLDERSQQAANALERHSQASDIRSASTVAVTALSATLFSLFPVFEGPYIRVAGIGLALLFGFIVWKWMSR